MNIYYDGFNRIFIEGVGYVDTYSWKGSILIVIIGNCLNDCFDGNIALIQNEGVLKYSNGFIGGYSKWSYIVY